MTSVIVLGIFALSVASVGAFIDARTGHIPNWLTLGALVAAPLFWLALGTMSAGLEGGAVLAGMSLLGALLCGLGPLVAFVRGGMGGGDVKLLAALGALLGPRHGLNAELAGFVVAALYVPLVLAWRGELFATMGRALLMLKNPFVARGARIEAPAALAKRIRLGPAILAGTSLAVGSMLAGAWS